MEITVAFYGSLGNLFGIISYQFADEFTETFTDIIKHKGPNAEVKFCENYLSQLRYKHVSSTCFGVTADCTKINRTY